MRPANAELRRAQALCLLGALFMLASPGLMRAAAAAEHYVAPAHPQASDQGEGSRSRPWKTLAHAGQALQPGDRLVIAAGLYRDALLLPPRAWSPARPTEITGEGEVEIRGTDLVSGWEQGPRGVLYKRDWPSEPQQVIVDGQPLTQLGGTIFDGYPENPQHPMAGLHRGEGGIWPTRRAGGVANLVPGSFWYDRAEKMLWLRPSTPHAARQEIEVSTRTWLLRAEQAAGLTIRKLRFRYANTSTLSRNGAVTVKGNDNRLESLVVLDSDGVGIELEGDRNVLKDSEVARAGYLGIKARGTQVQIVGNRAHHNNTRGFNKYWEAGGFKFIGDDGLKSSRVADNEAAYNRGDGIWFDWGNDDNLVQNNRSAYNQGFGIHYEASMRGRIVGNKVFGNTQRGIYLPHSHDCTVERNIVLANGLEGLTSIDEQRRDEAGRLDLRPARNRFFNNVVAWNAGLAVILPGREYANQSDGNVYLQDDDGPRFSMNWPKAWNRPLVLSAWRSNEGQDLHSRVVHAAPDATMKRALGRQSLQLDLAPLQQLIDALPTAALMKVDHGS